MKEKDKQIKIENNSYIVLENKNNCLNVEELESKYTDYFDSYDYILGDFAYNKLRLKGFCDNTNKKCNKINDIKTKDNYLKYQCAYECNYFSIKKINR